MAIYWSEESYFRKEMSKWDRPKRDGGMNRDGHEEYPKMLYKAQFNPLSGRNEIALVRDVLSPDKTVVVLDAEQFNATCHLVVNDESEEKRAKEDGWRLSQKEAMDYVEGREQEKAVAAAVRAYEDKNMSEKAQAEAKAFEESTAEHVAEIPAKRKRGRPRKLPERAVEG